MYVRGLFICLFTSLFFLEIIRADIGGMLVHSVLKSNQIAQHVIADAAGKTHKANGGPFYYFTFDLLTVSFGWAGIRNPVFPSVTKHQRLTTTNYFPSFVGFFTDTGRISLQSVTKF